ncbi:MAG: hypothetical protein AB7H90_22940 [Alphaproteobacteria bacterium]
MDGAQAGDHSLLGIGLYTLAEASRLTGIPASRLRRWLCGYTYRTGDDIVTAAPVWPRQVPDVDGTVGLGFLDLIEARFVDAFRKASVPLPIVRRCAARARALIALAGS